MGLFPLIILSAILGIILFFVRVGQKQKRNEVFEKIKETSDISGEIKQDFLLNKFKHLVIDENDKKEVGSVINVAITYDIKENDVIWIVEKDEITKLDFLVGNDTKWIEIYKVSDKELDKIIKKESNKKPNKPK
jgi:hypothetical protein